MAMMADALSVALAAHQSGRLGEAESLYQQILQRDPQNGDTLHLLGVLNHQAGNMDSGLSFIQKAIEQNNTIPQFYNSLGNLLADMGRLDESVEYFRKALELDPNLDESLLNLGVVLHQQSRLEEAVECYRKVIALNPGYAEVYSNLGNALKDQQKNDEALACYQQALALNELSMEAHYNISSLYADQQNYDQAVYHCKRAIEIKPDFAEAYNALGLLYREQGKIEEALAAYQSAASINPKLAEVFYNLGLLLGNISRTDDALLCHDIVLALEPEHHKAMFAKGICHFLKGDLAESTRWHNSAYQLKPENDLYKLRAETLCPIILENEDMANEYRKNLEKTLNHFLKNGLDFSLNDLPSFGVEPSFYLLYQGMNDLALKRKYGEIFETAFRKKWPHLMAPPKPSGNQRSKVGFLVTYRHEGVFCKLMLGYVNHLSRDKYDVTIICGSEVSVTALQSQITHPGTRYLVMPQNLEGKVKAIKAEGFDAICHFEVGTDAFNYFLPYFQLAPIQFSGMGFPVTSGISGMTDFLNSRYIDEPDVENHYTENVTVMDAMPAFFYRPALPSPLKTRSQYSLPEDKTLYISPQSLFKFHPEFDRVFAEILQRDPNAEIVLLEERAHWVEALKKRIAAHPKMAEVPDGMSRIRFAPRQNPVDFLNLIAVSDVMLDPFHVNGGITSHEGLAIGIPIVTYPSEHFRGRMTLSCYNRMNYRECVADSPEDYIDIAVKLGTDPEYRNQVRNEILNRNHVLFENLETVTALEQFLDTRLAQLKEVSPGGAEHP